MTIGHYRKFLILPKTLIILQCRMASKRLPGKALKLIKNIPTILICYKRLSNNGHKVIVATSNKKSNSSVSKSSDNDDKSSNNNLDKAINNSSNKSTSSSLPEPDDAGSRTQISKNSKSGYCYIGEDRGFRSCIKVDDPNKCMSGGIFPTRDICVNPSLRE